MVDYKTLVVDGTTYAVEVRIIGAAQKSRAYVFAGAQSQEVLLTVMRAINQRDVASDWDYSSTMGCACGCSPGFTARFDLAKEFFVSPVSGQKVKK